MGKKDAEEIKVTKRKADVEGKKTLLKTLNQNLAEAKTNLARAETRAKEAGRDTKHMHDLVESQKTKAGEYARQEELKKAQVQAKEQEVNQAKAEADSTVAQLRARVAEVGEKVTKSEQRAEELKT